MKVERVIIVSPCPRCGYKKVCSNYCAICGRRNDYKLETAEYRNNRGHKNETRNTN